MTHAEPLPTDHGAFAEPALRWVGAEGVRLAGDAWGPVDGPAVVLLHGSGQTRHAWKRTGYRLGELGYRAIGFDARGHGDSEWSPTGNYGLDARIADLRAVCADLGPQPVALVGASMGGGTSLVATGEGHLPVSTLVLVDIAVRVRNRGTSRIRDFMTGHPNGFGSLEEVAAAIAEYQPHRPATQRLAGVAKNVRRRPDGRYYWHWDPQITRPQADRDSLVARRTAAARQVTAPTLLVHGELSDVVDEASVDEFRELCPHAETTQVPGAAHMVAGDRNDEFGKALTGFLLRHVSRLGA